jgi:hypothetical protein
MDSEQGALAPVKTAETSNAAVLLGLYLLLLAFFILLVAISKIVETRSAAALDSINSAFSAPHDATIPIAFAPIPSGPIAEVEEFHGGIRAAVDPALPIAETFATDGGRVIRVRVSTNVAFVRDQAALSRAMPPFLDQLVEAMRFSAEGLRAEVELRVGTRDTVEPTSLGDAALAIQRAGLLARELVGAGLAPDAIGTGIDTDLAALELRFALLPSDAARITFEAEAGAP